MQLRLNPGRVRGSVMAAFVLAALAGCSTPYSSPGPMPTGLNARASFTVDVPLGTSPNNRPTVYLNGSAEGAAPVNVRVDVDELGNLAEDIEIKMEWPSGSSETIIQLKAGTRPPVVLRISPSGMVDY